MDKQTAIKLPMSINTKFLEVDLEEWGKVRKLVTQINEGFRYFLVYLFY